MWYLKSKLLKEDNELVFDLIGLGSVFQVRIVLEMNDFWYVDVWHSLVSYRKQFASVNRVVLFIFLFIYYASPT